TRPNSLAAPLLSFLPPHPPTSPLFPYTTLFRSPRLTFARHAALYKLYVIRPLRSLDQPLQEDEEGLEFMRLLVPQLEEALFAGPDRKSTRLNSSHVAISYAVFCLKKKIYQNQLI